MKRDSRCMSIFICAFALYSFLSMFSFEPPVLGQSQNIPPKDQEEGFKFAPIPMVQTVTQEGGGLALQDRYHLNQQNKTSSSSYTAIGGFVTGNRSWGAGIAQQFYLHDDRWRALLAGTYLDVRYNYYGIGTAAGERGGLHGKSVLLEQEAPAALGELMYRFYGWWYGGAQYRFLSTSSSFRKNPEFDPQIPSSQLDVNVATLGPRVMRDTRDATDYPRSGSLIDLQLGFSGRGTGGQMNYQTYNLSYNKYISVGNSGVLALRGASCFEGGNVPFFNLCLLSAAENLRGYRASRYRDRTMLASQGEYRWEAWKNLGFVAFAGLGEIGPNLGDFTGSNILPGGGAGVRYRITKENHVNLRFDYAWGKSSHEAYFFIGEVF